MFRIGKLSTIVAAALLTVGGCSGGGGGGGGGGDSYTPGGWTKFAGNPMLTPIGTWDAWGNWSPNVDFDGTTYRMWYAGSSSATNTGMGYATSIDGLTWAVHPSNPVLTSTPSTWDDSDFDDFSVVSTGSEYLLWYTSNSQFGLARSPDGITWTKELTNPVMVPTAGSFDATAVFSPNVRWDGTTYEMWYTGLDASGIWKTGYATSPDGITWTKSAVNPVLGAGAGGAWDAGGAAVPKVILDGAFYRMWFTGVSAAGKPSGIGYASSTDGINWTKYTGNPVIGLGAGSSWDDDEIWGGHVIKDGATYKMWYAAEALSGGSTRIGYATKQ